MPLKASRSSHFQVLSSPTNQRDPKRPLLAAKLNQKFPQNAKIEKRKSIRDPFSSTWPPSIAVLRKILMNSVRGKEKQNCLIIFLPESTTRRDISR